MGCINTKYINFAVCMYNYGGKGYSASSISNKGVDDYSYRRWITICDMTPPLSISDACYKIHDVNYGLAETSLQVRNADWILVNDLKSNLNCMDWIQFFLTLLVICSFTLLATLNIQVYKPDKLEMSAKKKYKKQMNQLVAFTRKDLANFTLAYKIKQLKI